MVKNVYAAPVVAILIAFIAMSGFTYAQTARTVKTYNITNYGAIGDGIALNTAAINKTIEVCSAGGGGMVIVPAGNYITGTVVLQNNVNLFLSQDATITGVNDLSAYKSLKLKAEDPARPINITVSDSSSWTKSLIQIANVRDVSITGTGTIDGIALVDSKGEEGRRGPHGIFMMDSKNINIADVKVTRSGNYNIIGLHVANVKITGITISQGADGIHIRDGKNLQIENCKLYTADDAIAGGYWDGMLIKDCLLNSSCNGIRVILPAINLEVKNCQISGPGVFGHPRGVPGHFLVNRSLTGIIVQPGAWGLGAGSLDHIYIHDVRIRDMQSAITFVLNEGNNAGDIKVENVVATGITKNACSVEAWPLNSSYRAVKFKNISVQYHFNDPGLLNVRDFKRPGTESRPLPYWGFYVRGVKNIDFENVKFTGIANDPRAVLGFDGVGSITLKNVTYAGSNGIVPFKYNKTTKFKVINSGSLNK
jgi:hypothetical protein